jgi:DNA repair photolyase
VEAQAPVIVSASRATDIPAFYDDWFFHRLEKGYSAWTNPFNGVKSYISYKDTRLIVFWSKNPAPLLDYLPVLKKKNIDTYIQYTLNDYEKEELEKGVPPLQERIDTFKRLVDAIGFGKVIWRFDPMIQTNDISKDDLLEKAEHIGNQLKGYTEKMVFSFADILSYRKVKNNLEKNNINYIEFSETDMDYLAQGLFRLNENWQYTLATCGEKIDLAKYGIQHNKCVDDDLMIKYFSHNKKLMDFLKVEIIPGGLFDSEPQIIRHKNNKDSGQRSFCGCISSKDIGEYNTCPHLCEYCYANASKELAIENWKRHENNKFTETITGK